MNLEYSPKFKIKSGSRESDSRVHLVGIVIVVVAFVIVFRLFILMILQNSFYRTLAAGSQEVFAELFPKRGNIFIQDTRTHEKYPLALNRDYFLLYSDNRLIENEKEAEEITNKLRNFFGYDEENKLKILEKLKKVNDPYEPIEKKIDEEKVEMLKAMNLKNLGFIRSPQRYYPENNLAAHVVGFLGKDNSGNNVGSYGIEGFWDKELAGSGGFYEGLKTAAGDRITFDTGLFEPARDGADVTLTIDRTLQFKACEMLEESRLEYEAKTASLIIIDPFTGAIKAMCSLPDFDPNSYGEVEFIDVYNNSTIFTPYEPGSIFKPIVMASAVDEKVVNPQTNFFDTGAKEGLCDTSIRNANDKIYGNQNMIGVLENSINTGMVFVSERLGKKRMRDYIKNFGFGIKTGIELDTESAGDISSLYNNDSDKVDCYTATASFGQGITVTPIQMVAAFGAIANGGILYKPFILDEIRYSNGKVEKTVPKEIRRVLSSSTSALVSGMLVNVIDSGQAKRAQVEGYYLAGKTGTAQIPGPGGYTEETNHSFVGFGPIDDPKFVMIVKFEKPKIAWADSTAAPLFRKVAKFVLEYYSIPPSR